MKRNFAFYLEALLLVAAFLAVVLVVTRSFGVAETQSRQAGQLTRAVGLAQNAAEAFAAADSPKSLQALLDEDGSAALDGATVTVDCGEGMLLRVRWQDEDGLARAVISVTQNEEECYTLETARAEGGNGA